MALRSDGSNDYVLSDHTMKRWKERLVYESRINEQARFHNNLTDITELAKDIKLIRFEDPKARQRVVSSNT